MRRAARLALVAWLACGSVLFAIDRHIGFGDSITAGTSWPSDCSECPLIFDCTGGCSPATAGSRERCGYVRRLDNWLGTGNLVLNRGWAGETTLQSVSRIDDVLDDDCGAPGPCLSVIYMEGTNDLFKGISPETSKNNVSKVVGKVKARNIDVLLMTVIREVFDPDDPDWRSFKNKILDLAGAENLTSVNNWLSLCPNTSCYNDKYWISGSECTEDGDDSLGHLDPDGYDVMFNLMKPAFPNNPPAAPAPAAPTGDLAAPPTEFTWPHLASARWYHLEVDGADSWWEAAVHCAGGTCSVDPGLPLAAGAHSWRVRARNLRGLGAFSPDTAFTIWEPPGVAAPSAPAGDFYDADPLAAPFAWEPYTWSAAADATGYDLEVSGVGGPVVQQAYDSSICLGGTCSAAPSAGLAAGDYSWRVRAFNPATSGPWSVPLAFTIIDSAPAAPSLDYPGGNLFVSTPLYQWQALPGAESYDLEVEDGSMTPVVSQSFAAAAVCSDGLCSVREGTVLAPGAHTWTVTAVNPIGPGPPSPEMAFNVLPCPDDSPVPLTGDPVTGTVVEEHCGPIRVASGGPYVVDPAADVTLHSRDRVELLSGTLLRGDVTIYVDK